MGGLSLIPWKDWFQVDFKQALLATEWRRHFLYYKINLVIHLIKVVMQQLLVRSFLICSFKQWLFCVYHCFLVWVANQLAFSFQAAAT